MIRIFSVFAVVGCCMLSCSGDREKRLTLDGVYDSIRSIRTVAACKGPGGLYTTETRAASGYFYFHQRFTYRDQPYTAIIHGLDGVEVDTTRMPKDTLDAATVEAILSHNFHWIAMRPHEFYDSIHFVSEVKNEGKLLDKYQGLNSVHQPVIILFNPSEQLIEQIEFDNPMDEKEHIVVKFSDWTETDFGRHPYHVEITQGDVGTFTFDFTEIKVNDPKFLRVVTRVD